MDNWRKAGVFCPAERHSGLRDNFAFAEVSERDIAEMARAVGQAGVDAVAIVCTNMRGRRPRRAAGGGARRSGLQFDRDDAVEEPPAR